MTVHVGERPGVESLSAAPLPEPMIVDAPRRLVLYEHALVEHDNLPSVIGNTFDALYKRIYESGMAPAGPPFIMYLDDSEPGVRWSIDICAPVGSRVANLPEFKVADIPAGRAVSLLHVGPYDRLGAAYAAISDFIAARGLKQVGPPREFYMSEPDTPASEIRTLIEFPIA